MRKISSFLFFAVLILFLSCQKEQSPQTGTISGNLSSYDPATPLVKTPVAGIKLWLVNADFKFDTVTFAGNRAAIVDSTYSDANGNYRFSSIPLGNYYVSPLPDTAGYRFEPVPEGNTDPLAISESSLDQNLSFSSPRPGGENATFKIVLTVYKNGNNIPKYYKWRRQYWAVFIPFFSTIQGGGEDMEFKLLDEPAVMAQNFEYGAFAIAWTISNNFLLDFYNSDDVLVDSYWIVQDLGNTPSESTWEIDLNTHTISRTSP